MDILALIATAAKALAGFVLAVLLALLPASAPQEPRPAAEAPATTTDVALFPAVEEPEPAPPPQAPEEEPATVAAKPVVPLPALPPAPAIPALSAEVLNATVRASLVNILCTTQAGGSFKPISGSGVVVDSRGVILTNAHVAQFFLLRDYLSPGNVECVVRTGSPARSLYRATLLYLPPSWIENNAEQIKQQVATGTGEHDYAFLLITGTTNPSGTLPTFFPALPMAAGSPDTGQEMILAAYPAGLLSGELIATNLYASSAFAAVTKLYSYNDTEQVDLFAIGGTVASQAGSSGGAAASMEGKLRGVITTATLGATTGESNLFALSLGHIDRSLQAHGQGGIQGLLSGVAAAKAAQFNATIAPALTQKLEAVLSGN